MKLKTLNVGDKFYIPVKGKDVEFVVIGKDINPNPEEKEHFIDVMSTSLYLTNIQWLEKDDNENYLLFYPNSDIMKLLEEQKQYLPQEIQDAIIPRKAKFLTRIDIINNKVEYEYVDIGSIWLPSLKEVANETNFTDDCPENQQYPYFEDDQHKQLGGCWCLRSARALYDWGVCYVDYIGDWDYDVHYLVVGVPLCLRLKVDN